jgi:hypothetical protein
LRLRTRRRRTLQNPTGQPHVSPSSVIRPFGNYSARLQVGTRIWNLHRANFTGTMTTLEKCSTGSMTGGKTLSLHACITETQVNRTTTCADGTSIELHGPTTLARLHLNVAAVYPAPIYSYTICTK